MKGIVSKIANNIEYISISANHFAPPRITKIFEGKSSNPFVCFSIDHFQFKIYIMKCDQMIMNILEHDIFLIAIWAKNKSKNAFFLMIFQFFSIHFGFATA